MSVAYNPGKEIRHVFISWRSSETACELLGLQVCPCLETSSGPKLIQEDVCPKTIHSWDPASLSNQLLPSTLPQIPTL